MSSPARLTATEFKARNAEHKVLQATSSRQAFAASIRAAELYMQALKLADNPTDRSRLEAKCKDLLDRSEQFKEQSTHTGPNGSLNARDSDRPYQVRRDRKEPLSNRALTTREKIILVEGSKLNGFKFPIWEQPPKDAEFELNDGQQQFVDSPPLQLSALQLESFGGWKRPKEALAGIEIIRDGQKLPNDPTMESADRIDLVQDMTSDCSVVASLCAGSSRAERGHPKILSSVVYPYNQEDKRPELSASGRYVLRLFFNGCYRRVEIDDLLPASNSSRVLHVLDRSNPGCLWPALLEKSYLKVRGGYDFPGSNSGTDIAVFTGWIPEQIFLHDEDVLPDELWTRIFDGFNLGEVLLTIGTGRLPRQEQKHLGLAAEHDYAILDLKERSGVREMLIKNPWSSGDVWKGAARQRPNPPHDGAASPVIDSIKDPADDMTPGTFWMDFGSVFQHFETLYLNWQPGLFKCREDIHFSWDLTQTDVIPGIFESHPQISVKSQAATDVWILLNRHFKTGDYTSSMRHASGFISLYLFHADGRRVLLSNGAKLRGPFVDSPNTLLTFKMPAGVAYTIIVASQGLPLAKHNFSLSAFSNSPVQLAHAHMKYSRKAQQHGAWTRSMSGGNSDSPNYLTNPQFSFKLLTQSAVALTLSLDHSRTPSASAPETHVKLLVVFTDGSRVTKLRPREIVANSGDYRRGSAAIEQSLERGTYTVICSTYDKDQHAKFTLSLHTSSENPTDLRPLPPEGSGRLSITSQEAFFSPTTTRLLAPLTIPRLSRTTFIAKPPPSSSNTATRPSSPALFKLSLEQGQGPYKSCLASSASVEDEFAELATGVRIDDIDLQPEMQMPEKGGLWLVIEKMPGISSSDGEERASQSVQIEILTEERLELGTWGHGDG